MQYINVMKGKQILIDIGVVLVFPALFLVISNFWGPSDDSALLSLVSPKDAQPEFGAKAKSALKALRTIDLKASAVLFDDPVFQSLEEFHVDIAPTTLGRTYPFVTPEAVRTKAAKSR